MAKQQFLLTGTGGQGLILAAIMFGDAGVLVGQNVVQSQSYGPEARGGASRAEVILSSEVIHYPKVNQPDLVLILSQEAYKKYGLSCNDDVLLIVDNTYVTEVKPRSKNFYALPITRTARNEFQSEQSANVVALGVLAAFTPHVSMDAFRFAVQKRAPRGTEERNLKALEAGWILGQQALSVCQSQNIV